MDLWQSLGSIIWWFIGAVIFIAYLMVLFSIIADVFRDRALTGWAKAVWILLLAFVPLFTALIYLIARREGMAERHTAALHRRLEADHAYLRKPVRPSPSQEIDTAAKLRDAGTIAEAEFEALKSRALT